MQATLRMGAKFDKKFLFFWRTPTPTSHHLSRFRLYLFVFSEKEKNKKDAASIGAKLDLLGFIKFRLTSNAKKPLFKFLNKKAKNYKK